MFDFNCFTASWTYYTTFTQALAIPLGLSAAIWLLALLRLLCACGEDNFYEYVERKIVTRHMTAWLVTLFIAYPPVCAAIVRPL